jgi:hypothetical protein
LRQAGVEIIGSSPAVVDVTCYIQVPATTLEGKIVPNNESFPVIAAGSVFTSDAGIEYILLEDIDFSKTKSDGSYVAEARIAQKNSSGNPTSFTLALTGRCVSGRETTETFQIGSDFVPFRRIGLSNPNVTEIVNVSDTLGNTYYRVSSLSHDVVYQNVENISSDVNVVPEAIKVVPAPYRFVAQTDLSERKTTLVFGGGSADTLEDDVIPDPSDFAISLPYTKTFSRVSVNPEKLLATKTLGVAATSTTLTVTYRFGGGLDHNAPAGTIRNVKTLFVKFPRTSNAATMAFVRSSVEVSNENRAVGGEDAPEMDDLKSLIPSMRNSQDRMVSRSDIIARLYTMPTNFGRIFRAGVASNPNNPLATQLFIVSRSTDKRLVMASDTLKSNIVKYLNPYRMISDAIDVLDARVINIKVLFEVLVDPTLTATSVLQAVLVKLSTYLDVKNFHIDQPLVLSNVRNVIFSVPGVVSVNGLQVINVNGIVDGREYSDVVFDVASNTKKDIVFPPTGGIFECRYVDVDIIGRIA